MWPFCLANNPLWLLLPTKLMTGRSNRLPPRSNRKRQRRSWRLLALASLPPAAIPMICCRLRESGPASTSCWVHLASPASTRSRHGPAIMLPRSTANSERSRAGSFAIAGLSRLASSRGEKSQSSKAGSALSTAKTANNGASSLPKRPALCPAERCQIGIAPPFRRYLCAIS